MTLRKHVGYRVDLLYLSKPWSCSILQNHDLGHSWSILVNLAKKSCIILLYLIKHGSWLILLSKYLKDTPALSCIWWKHARNWSLRLSKEWKESNTKNTRNQFWTSFMTSTLSFIWWFGTFREKYFLGHFLPFWGSSTFESIIFGPDRFA